jgi:hypothetical protein
MFSCLAPPGIKSVGSLLKFVNQDFRVGTGTVPILTPNIDPTYLQNRGIGNVLFFIFNNSDYWRFLFILK